MLQQGKNKLGELSHGLIALSRILTETRIHVCPATLRLSKEILEVFIEIVLKMLSKLRRNLAGRQEIDYVSKAQHKANDKPFNKDKPFFWTQAEPKYRRKLTGLKTNLQRVFLNNLVVKKLLHSSRQHERSAIVIHIIISQV